MGDELRIHGTGERHPGEQLTIIGPDTKIKGEMFFEKSARILGQFEGKITAKGEVQVGAGALCRAAVEAERVVVDGTVAGPIHARERLTLTATAQVQGDLTAGTLVVAEGASFVGHCQVGPKAQAMLKNGGGQPTTGSTAELKPSPNEPAFRPPWATQAEAGAA